MAEAQSKTQPHNIQAEQCVLGCLMLDYFGCSDGLEKLHKSDFYSPVHRTIFQAMTNLLEKKDDKVLDFVTVTEALSVMGQLDAIGGIAYLNTISDSVPSVANFRQYLDIVKKNSTLRKLEKAAKQILESTYASDDEQATLAEAEKTIFDVSKEDERTELTSLGNELPAVIDRLDIVRKDPTAIYGIKTGFYLLDNVTNGLHGGELILLAARPGIGKTSLGLNMIMNAALYSGKKCAIFSLEMSKTSLTQRAICSLASVSSYKAGRGELTNAEWQRLLQANEVLSNAPIYIDDNSEITASEIRRKCMSLKRRHNLDFVMVDYLGLMATRSDGRSQAGLRYENRQTEVAANSRAMKILAKELNIPVLLLAQLNRESVSRQGKTVDQEPQLHHLRESGAIEQDADIVMFIHMNKSNEPTEEDEQDNGPIDAKIIVAKHRNGPTKSFYLDWYKETTTFKNKTASQSAQDARDALKR